AGALRSAQRAGRGRVRVDAGPRPKRAQRGQVRPAVRARARLVLSFAPRQDRRVSRLCFLVLWLVPFGCSGRSMDAPSQAGKADDHPMRSEDVAEPAEPPTDNADVEPGRPGAGPAYFLAAFAREHELVWLSVDGEFGVVSWPTD